MAGTLEADLGRRAKMLGQCPFPSTFQINQVVPTGQTSGGFVKIADSSTFKASKTIAAAIVTCNHQPVLPV